jgi:hypothetical protein
MQKSFFFTCLLLLVSFFCNARVHLSKDSLPSPQKKIASADTSEKKIVKKFSPRTATIRSAIAPGLGQIYNKKYWKLPLVWGALGITAVIFFDNVKTYNRLKSAYINLNDSNDLNNIEIDPQFRGLSAGAIRSYRNSFRQNIDYSALFFLLFWGLNVVDAAVDAHLKSFDVNDNLSLQIKQGYSPMANTTGISLVLNIGKRKNPAR